MSNLYFIRHAQAGSPDNYDVLSELGQEQARRLGEYLTNQGIEFSAIHTGLLRRQRHTAELVCKAMSAAGLHAPEVKSDSRWDEFSLASLYSAFTQRMIDESAEFARDFEEMQQAIRRDPHSTKGATGRCDAAVVRAWIENRYTDYEGESWAAFKDRVGCCAADLSGFEKGRAVAVFTSATPIAVVTAAALGLTEDKLLSILGVIYNTSITVLQARDERLRLFSFNGTPHLSREMTTLR